MAILTALQNAESRRYVQASTAPCATATKSQVNAALQACENYYETTARAGFGAAMEAAAPGVFTNAQKKQIGKYFILQKAGRE